MEMMTLQISNSEHSPQQTFDLLHRDIQEQLYRMEWTELRPVQVQAIRAILQGNLDIIITAPTAGGKTEAAFLPILSHILDLPCTGLRSMYIGPLKALINDQFQRLEDICEHTGIPVHRWHGDVSMTHKRSFLDNPSGVLLITPESLEAMFVNRADRLGVLFSGLDFIVIDELHSFFGSERGAHLRSLMSRVSRYCSKTPRLVALSATLGDLRLACSWLKQKEASGIEIVQDKGGEREIRLGVRAYGQIAHQSLTEGENQDEEDNLPNERLVSDLFRHFHGKKALVFGNQKSRIELYADAVKTETARRGEHDNFLVHHGSLGRLEREDAEDELRSDRRVAVFCSSTLELGIDIGPVEVVGQLGCLPSVNSLLQRLGRSGRRKEHPATMRLYCEVQERRDSPLPDRLCLDLVELCAMCQLAIHGWCEPPPLNKMHLSTLVHQILALIVERGGIHTPELYADLVLHGAFPGLSESQFAMLLRDMGTHELIEQDDTRLLILGRIGERLARHYSFYSVFQTPVEFDVKHEHRTIGSVAYTPSPDASQYLILSGKRWQITSVDQEAHVLHVVPSRGKRAPTFSSGSKWELDDMVTQMMQTILASNEELKFCDANASMYINRARQEARSANIIDKSLSVEGKKILWFTWRGSRVNRTLLLIMKSLKLTCDDSYPGLLIFDSCDPQRLLNILRSVDVRSLSIESLAAHQPRVATEKYDMYMPEELWRYQYSVNSLDIEGAAIASSELLANS